MDFLFLDTSFIIALEDADDQNHKIAVAYWKTFKRNPRKIITTSYIFDETVTFLKRRISHLLKFSGNGRERAKESPDI